MRSGLVRSAVALAAVTLIGACVKPIDENADTTNTVGATGSAGGNVAAAPAIPVADPAMRLEVDVTARKLYVFKDGAVADTHDIAVGSSEWPTATGNFRIIQVVFNPEWIPPTDEAWAKDEKPEAPGDPQNPLGRAQLVYDPPRSIHGTNQPASIGKAVSHGSIRMRNETILALAREVMEAAGVQRDASWFAQTQRNRTTKEIVDLPAPIPIVIR